MASAVEDLELRYRDTETMLYAQSIGFGQDPLDAKELPFVYEQGSPLRTVPSMASVLVPNMFPRTSAGISPRCCTPNNA